MRAAKKVSGHSLNHAAASGGGGRARCARVVALLVTASLLLASCGGDVDEISSVAPAPLVDTETPEVTVEPPAPAPRFP